MFLVLRKEPSEVCKKSGFQTYQRKYFDSRKQLQEQLHEEFGENILNIRHPTLQNVLILYSNKPGQKSNFRLSPRGEMIKGTVYFVSNVDISLSETDCDKIIRNMNFYTISKEYIAKELKI